MASSAASTSSGNSRNNSRSGSQWSSPTSSGDATDSGPQRAIPRARSSSSSTSSQRYGSGASANGNGTAPAAAAAAANGALARSAAFQQEILMRSQVAANTASTAAGTGSSTSSSSASTSLAGATAASVGMARTPTALGSAPAVAVSAPSPAAAPLVERYARDTAALINHTSQQVEVQTAPEGRGLEAGVREPEEGKASTAAAAIEGERGDEAMDHATGPVSGAAEVEGPHGDAVADRDVESSSSQEAVVADPGVQKEQQQRGEQEVPQQGAVTSPGDVTNAGTVVAEAGVPGREQVEALQLGQRGAADGVVGPAAMTSAEHSPAPAVVGAPRIIRLSGVWEKDLQVRMSHELANNSHY